MTKKKRTSIFYAQTMKTMETKFVRVAPYPFVSTGGGLNVAPHTLSTEPPLSPPSPTFSHFTRSYTLGSSTPTVLNSTQAALFPRRGCGSITRAALWK